MDLLDKMLGREKNQQVAPTLMEDIPKAAEWFQEAMDSSGYTLDGTLESFQEVDRFVEEQGRPGGVLQSDLRGKILFGMGSYIGQTLIAQLGGQWETNDADPQGEVNIAVHMNGGTVWPVQKALKRLINGPEDSIYAYGIALKRYGK